jgi:3-oxoacyl-[acyl-carrier-protein] synthase-3
MTAASTGVLFKSRITGTGACFPETRLTNEEISRKVDTSHDWIVERTGIHERRVSRPLTHPEEHNSSMAVKAALAALEKAGKKPEDIDAILVGTCSGDTRIPSTACWIQHKLGAHRAWAVDLNAACSGFLYALSVTDQFIKTGSVRCALVIGSEVLSPLVDWEDRTSCILFGDGSGAAIVEQTPGSDPRGILYSRLRSEGEQWELIHMPAGGTALPVTPENSDQIEAERLNKIKMKGREIFKIAVKTLTDLAEEALQATGYTVADVDWFVPHQANMRIIEAVAKRLDFPMEKVIVNIERFGNTSAATVPTALDEGIRSGKIKEGQLVLLDVFGAGLTSGVVLLRV